MYVDICIYTHICIYIFIYIYIYVYAYVFIHIYACMFLERIVSDVYFLIHSYKYVHLNIHTKIQYHMHVVVREIWVLCVCLSLSGILPHRRTRTHTCTHSQAHRRKHTHTDTQSHAHSDTDTWTPRHTDKETDTQRYKHTESQRHGISLSLSLCAPFLSLLLSSHASLAVTSFL